MTYLCICLSGCLDDVLTYGLADVWTVGLSDGFVGVAATSLDVLLSTCDVDH